MQVTMVPVEIAASDVRWADIELFRHRFTTLAGNLRDLNLRSFKLGLTKQPDGRYTGSSNLPSEHRIKSLYLDYRHFHLQEEPTHLERFANYLCTLSDSEQFRAFIKNEKSGLKSRAVEDGWIEYKGGRLSTQKLIDWWFSAELFHSGRPEQKAALAELKQVFAGETAKSMLFMGVLDRIGVIRNINWVALELSPTNMYLRMPASR